jgi:hypothetical protein
MRQTISTLLFLWVVLSPLAWANSDAISEETLSQEIAARTDLVPEFTAIRKMAEERGVRVWLFGGTAAAFAHYVKWDHLRQNGDARYQKERFDYDFTNIYRSTQDLDIVVDGTTDQVREIQNLLQKKFPYFMGSKEQWEVRSLREQIDDKEPLLNNADFLNQHTDSNSTGMIELTHSSEAVIRDLRDWGSDHPQFLKDIAEGKPHYYYSGKHGTTRRFREGKNPPIFSVIRYLTKMFQFELETRPEDLATIQEIIRNFDPQSVQTEYVRAWLEKNGPKLVSHAADVEFESDTIQRFGLRRKLIATSDIKSENSLAWWIDREPLRSFPVGQGDGKSLAQICQEQGIDPAQLVVSHETKTFQSYEALTRNTKGTPNVFISRKGKIGEAAVYGNGHYTRIGQRGLGSSGLTIRYVADLNAREGSDFNFVEGTDYVIWQNRNALRVIPESLNFNALTYLHALTQGAFFDPSDRGMREKLRRRIGHQLYNYTPAEKRALVTFVRSKLDALAETGGLKSNSFVHRYYPPGRQIITPIQVMFEEWFDLPISAEYPELIEEGIQTGSWDGGTWIELFSGKKPWVNRPEIVEALLAKNNTQTDYAIASHILSSSLWDINLSWLETIVARGNLDNMGALATGALQRYQSIVSPDLMDKFLVKMPDKLATPLIRDFFQNGWFGRHPEYVNKLLDMNEAELDHQVHNQIGFTPKWPEANDRLVKNGNLDNRIITRLNTTGTGPYAWAEFPKWQEWISTILNRGNVDSYFVAHLLKNSKAPLKLEWLETILHRNVRYWNFLDKNVLNIPFWANHPELNALLNGKPATARNLSLAFKKRSCDQLLRAAKPQNP